MIPSGRSAGSLERDIEHTRARMDSTLASLEASFTPGQLMDRAFGYLKNNDAAKRAGKKVGQSAWTQMKNNPVAFAMMGAGVAYWIFGGKDRSREGRVRTEEPRVDVYVEEQYAVGVPSESVYGATTAESEPGIKERMSGKAEEARLRAKSRAEEARLRAKSTAEGAKNKVAGASARVSSSVKGAASSVKAKASDLSSGARTRASDMGRSVRTAANRAAASGRSAASKARQRASRAGEDLSTQAREHPFVFAAIAFAVTAGIGALLRPTRREDRLLGPRRDRLVERADELGARGVERAQGVANRAFDAAHEQLSTNGDVGQEPMDAETSDLSSGLETTGTVPPTTSFESSADREIDRPGTPPVSPEPGSEKRSGPSSGDELGRH